VKLQNQCILWPAKA